eukprot:1158086-Pelagomonas_calceolata.AAC.1
MPTPSAKGATSYSLLVELRLTYFRRTHLKGLSMRHPARESVLCTDHPLSRTFALSPGKLDEAGVQCKQKETRTWPAASKARSCLLQAASAAAKAATAAARVTTRPYPWSQRWYALAALGALAVEGAPGAGGFHGVQELEGATDAVLKMLQSFSCKVSASVLTK